MIRVFFLLVTLVLQVQVHAQNQNWIKQEKANTDSFSFNQKNAKGKAVGLWYRFVPERMGEDAYFEFGYYNDGKRNGPWYKLTRMGDLISIENYKNNTLSGEAKYYESGKLSAIGHYRGFEPSAKTQTILIIDPVTHEEYYKEVENDRGVTKHGSWKYYNTMTGALVREEEWQVDELINFTNHMRVVDSAVYKKQIENLPHNKHPKSKPTTEKRLTGDY